MKIAGDKSIGAEGGAGDAVEGLLEEIRRRDALCEGDGLIAQLCLGVNENGLIDEVLKSRKTSALRAAG